MGCNCGGAKIGTLDRPAIAGKANGVDPVEVRTLKNVGIARAGRTLWVTGTRVQNWIDDGLAEYV